MSETPRDEERQGGEAQPTDPVTNPEKEDEERTLEAQEELDEDEETAIEDEDEMDEDEDEGTTRQ
jgi:hypothetical protein